MTKVKASFENQKVYVGLDIHKRSWNAAIYLNEQFIRNIHQPPTPQALHHYLQHNYRQAKYVCAYECGKFGYCIQREFKQLGIECLVVNPADIPSTHKDEVYKTDSRDARGIRQALSSGQLKSIYVPYEDQEADRHLVRQRKKIWRDLIRCKNRIKGFLDYTGTEAPAQYDNANWSRNFINWLSKIEFDYSSNRVTLNYQITEMELLRKELLSISNTI